jgi:predicted transcriptional regulator
MDDDTGAFANVESDLVELSTEIVSAYVSHNAVSPGDLPRLIADVHTALRGLKNNETPAPVEELKPAVPIRKSIAPDYIICLEDGKKFKSLKRHLRTHYNLSPEEYREKWGLPADYPMVAPSYSATRSKLAKDNGLGRKAS